MKRPIIILLLIISASHCAFAQWPDLTCNGLRDGDTHEFTQIDFVDTVVIRDGAMWDLSQCSVGSGINVKLTQAIDSLPLISCIVDRTRYCYRLSGDTVFIEGFENNQSEMLYDISEISLQFPITPGQVISGEFNGEGQYCDRWHHRMNGTYRTEADATGTIIMPEGDTIANIIRISTWRQVDSRYYSMVGSTTETLSDSLRFYQQEKRWYAPGFRYPLLMTSTLLNSDGVSIRNHKAYYSSVAMSSSLENDPDNENLRLLIAEHGWHKESGDNKRQNEATSKENVLDCTFSQNPITGAVSVTVRSEKTVDIEIVLSDAMGIVYASEKRVARPEEPLVISFDCSRLPQTANYGLSVNAGTERHSEKFHR